MAFSSGHLTISKIMTIQIMAMTIIRGLVGLIYAERLMIKFCTYNTYHARITNTTSLVMPMFSKAATDINSHLFTLTGTW